MKTVTYFVVGLLLISSFAAVSIGKEAGVLQGKNLAVNSNDELKKTISLSFLEPEASEISTDGVTYLELDVAGANSVLSRGGEPLLPVYKTTMEFEFGTKITDVEISMDNIENEELPYEILPAPEPVPIGYAMDEAKYKQSKVYNMGDLFPDNWVDYYASGGMDPETHEQKTFCTVIVYPVRYSPSSNVIKYMTGDVEVTVTYEEPLVPITFGNGGNLTIIAPSKFENALKDFKNHKNNYCNIPTTIKTTEDIYTEYSGVDKPEKIKYFIKDAKETMGVDYVLLVGGLDSLLYGVPKDDRNKGVKDYLVPVRYTNLRDSGDTYDPGYISDLYYADLYDDLGDFDDWDSNGNGIFAEWRGINKDVIDHVPDVVIGRLACRSKFEVNTVTNKIINYEKGVGSWYDKMVLIGGDSHDDAGTNYAEGEYVCEQCWDRYMSGFTPTRVYASNKGTSKPIPVKKDIRKAINGGCGHLLFEGHGNPSSWDTHYLVEDGFKWIGGIKIYDFPLLLNGAKLPVCIIGGCHNSQFNVSLLWTLSDDKKNSHHSWTYGLPVPWCFSWWLVRKIGGGTIASMGNTGLGYGAVGEHGDQDKDGQNDPDTFERFGGYQSRRFYKAIDDGEELLGDCWASSVIGYCQVFPPMDYQIDAKSVQQWPLFGDPTMKLGGYSFNNGVKARIADGEAGFTAIQGENIKLQGVASNGNSPYNFEWDLDNDGQFDDATGETVSCEFNQPGVTQIGVKVTDILQNTDTYNTMVKVEPSATTTVKGENNVEVGKTKDYTITTETNSYWNKVLYQYDWGDGSTSGWLGPFSVDEKLSASHCWDEEGTYEVRTMVIYIHDVPDDVEDLKISEWSSPVNINVETHKQPTPLFLELLAKISPRLS